MMGRTPPTPISITSCSGGSQGIPDSWRKHWLARITDLVDNYQPGLLYTDGALPFEEYGLRLVSHHYNTSKRREDCEAGTCVLDVERGIVDQLWPNPWQTDTCVGQWHYKFQRGRTLLS